MNNGDNFASSPQPWGSIQVTRPGIRPETLAAAQIRHVSAEAANNLVGYNAGGIAIPYFHLNGAPLWVNGRHFARLRLDRPTSSAKYLSPKESGCQLYIPPSLQSSAITGGVLYITEGEFKALALTEAGYPSVAIGGITSGLPGGELLPALAEIISQHHPSAVAFVGDNDTCLIYDFSREATKLAKTTTVPIILPRIPLDAPGKGPDDLRKEWGDLFPARWQDIVSKAERVTADTTPEALAVRLLRLEENALSHLAGDKRDKARTKIIELASAVGNQIHIGDIQKIAEGTLGIEKRAFQEAVKGHGVSKKAESSIQLVSDVVAKFAMNGENPIAFDGKDYWTKQPDFVYRSVSREDIRLRLNQAGLSKYGDAPPCDAALLEIQDKNAVDYAGILCGRPAGIHIENGVRVLVTRGVNLPQGVRGSWPTIKNLLLNLFGQSQNDRFTAKQFGLFVGWLKYARSAIRNPHEHCPGQVMAFVGPPDSGKSLIQSLIITPALGGRWTEPSFFFTGQTIFNSELWGAEHLAIGDKALDLNGTQRTILRNELKRAIAESIYPLHPKGRDASSFRPIWRITLTGNIDPESACNLPALDGGFADKIIYLKCYAPPKPFFDAQITGAREEFRRQLESELPAFLSSVDRSETPPELKKGRFGITEWHHPEIVELLRETDPLQQIEEVLEKWIDRWIPGQTEQSLTTNDLYLKLDESYQRNLSRHKISSGPKHLGRQLAQLQKREGWNSRLSREEWRTGPRTVNKKVRGWTIRKDSTG